MNAGWLALAIVAQLAAASADLITTHHALASGHGREANALMTGGRGPAIKLTVSITLTAGSLKLWRSGKQKQAIALQLIPAATWGAVAIHNRRLY